MAEEVDRREGVAVELVGAEDRCHFLGQVLDAAGLAAVEVDERQLQADHCQLVAHLSLGGCRPDLFERGPGEVEVAEGGVDAAFEPAAAERNGGLRAVLVVERSRLLVAGEGFECLAGVDHPVCQIALGLEEQRGVSGTLDESDRLLQDLDGLLRIASIALRIGELDLDLALIPLVSERAVESESLLEDRACLEIAALIDPQRAEEAVELSVHRRALRALRKEKKALLESALGAEQIRGDAVSIAQVGAGKSPHVHGELGDVDSRVQAVGDLDGQLGQLERSGDVAEDRLAAGGRQGLDEAEELVAIRSPDDLASCLWRARLELRKQTPARRSARR